MIRATNRSFASICSPIYRFRVGEYRVILTIEDEHLLILVLETGSRIIGRVLGCANEEYPAAFKMRRQVRLFAASAGFEVFSGRQGCQTEPRHASGSPGQAEALQQQNAPVGLPCYRRKVDRFDVVCGTLDAYDNCLVTDVRLIGSTLVFLAASCISSGAFQ